MTGKPYSGKLNVRFDEGELEIGHSYYASSLLYPYPSRSLIRSVYVLRIAKGKTLHHFKQRFVRFWLCQKMNMITHETVCHYRRFPLHRVFLQQ